MSLSAPLFSLRGVSLLSSPGTLIVMVPKDQPSLAGCRFLPQFFYAAIKTKVGTITTSPTIRIGTNATHDNVAPSYTPPTSVVVGSIASLPLAVPLKAPPIDTADLVFEIVTPGVGPSDLTCDVVLEGLLIG